MFQNFHFDQAKHARAERLNAICDNIDKNYAIFFR